MYINWKENPLETTVDVDDRDRQMLLLVHQNNRYLDILIGIDIKLSFKYTSDKSKESVVEQVLKRLEPWCDVCDLEPDCDAVEALVSDLQHTHMGDCVCFPAGCIKCYAEEALGIDTIEGLGKHQASKIFHAFDKTTSGSIDEAIEILRQPTVYTEEYDKIWSSQKAFEKHIPRWETERSEALEWLQTYKQTHGF